MKLARATRQIQEKRKRERKGERGKREKINRIRRSHAARCRRLIEIRGAHPRDNQKAGVLRDTGRDIQGGLPSR